MGLLGAPLCLTLCDPTDLSPAGCSVLEIVQARILEWVAVFSSKGSFQLRAQTCNSCMGRRILYLLAPLLLRPTGSRQRVVNWAVGRCRTGRRMGDMTGLFRKNSV